MLHGKDTLDDACHTGSSLQMANVRLDTTNPQLARSGPALTYGAVNRSHFCWIPSFGAGPLK